MTMTAILLALNLLALVGLGAWLYQLKTRADALHAGARSLAAEAGALPADVRAEARAAGVTGVPFYTIEILNPLEVAAQESRLGKVFAGLTPAIVRGEVYRQAHTILREELGKRGIKADVRLHG